jgi:hypothetical protein
MLIKHDPEIVFPNIYLHKGMVGTKKEGYMTWQDLGLQEPLAISG